jgi:L-alanine-DL-glutamate epimerase-like enolase superfamily enzyme
MNIYQLKNTGTAITKIITTAYAIPTDTPEADGTKEWDKTIIVLVEIEAGGQTGTGYTYADIATAYTIEKVLKPMIISLDCMQVEAVTRLMIRGIRNSGTCGVAMMAVSAVNNALWDVKARLLQIPLYKLLGAAHNNVPVYGSGGFTSYSNQQLQHQFEAWAAMGINAFKMKIGRHFSHDINRVQHARNVIGNDAALFVDANGAYSTRTALAMAARFEKYNVTWFEEPVSSDNLAGLNFIRNHITGGCNIAAGEYGYHPAYFKTMLDAGAVDVLQADATRCGGISNFLKAGYLCEAWQLPFSFHCAPAIHLHAALALPAFYVGEYFHDHERIENMLFDGVQKPVSGCLVPDTNAPGLGITFKHKDAEKYKL